PHGGIEYVDAQVDDARLVLTLVRSAAGLGASAANRVRVLEYLRGSDSASPAEAGSPPAGEASSVSADAPRPAAATPASSTPDDPRPVTGVRVRDEETGDEFTIHAQSTILATGVWTGQQQVAAGAHGGLEVLASKGIHVTVPRDWIAAPPGLGIIT